MGHEPHVAPVDAHAEGVGGDHRVETPAHELLLHVGPLGVGEPGVVRLTRPPDLLADEAGQGLAVFPRGDVDQPGLVGPRVQEPVQHLPFLVGRGGGLDLENQVWAVEAGNEAGRVAEVELRGDVVLDARGGRRRQRDAGRVAHPPAGGREREVVRPKVVAPLAHAVRLVDGEQRHADLPEGLLERRQSQALGRGVDQPEAPTSEVR